MIRRVTLSKEDIRIAFPNVPDRMNKGGMGRVLVICGSYDPCGLSMCGAAYFAAKAAYRCGAGIVEIFTPRENYAALAAMVPEAVFSLYGYEESNDAVCTRIASSLQKSDAVVLGCGLGKSEMAVSLVSATLKNVACPLLIDADALNILSENDALWSLLSERQRTKTVITPHPGEMSRLCKMSVDDILSDPVGVARGYADKQGIVCLLKDHNTVITDGELVYINQSGNSGMATAGMGDVLAGMIGSLLARSEKRADFDENEIVLTASAVGAHLHGRAGDLASDRLGRYSLNSGDLLSQIPDAILENFG